MCGIDDDYHIEKRVLYVTDKCAMIDDTPLSESDRETLTGLHTSLTCRCSNSIDLSQTPIVF